MHLHSITLTDPGNANTNAVGVGELDCGDGGGASPFVEGRKAIVELTRETRFTGGHDSGRLGAQFSQDGGTSWENYFTNAEIAAFLNNNADGIVIKKQITLGNRIRASVAREVAGNAITGEMRVNFMVSN